MNKIEKKFYVHCEIEVNAHDESSAASYVKRQMGSSQAVVDIVKRYPSGFFERQMDQRKGRCVSEKRYKEQRRD